MRNPYVLASSLLLAAALITAAAFDAPHVLDRILPVLLGMHAAVLGIRRGPCLKRGAQS